MEDFQFPFSANLKNSNSHEKSKLIIPYNFSKFRKCSNLKKDHELCILFATLVVVLLLFSSFVTCMLLQALPWYCCWSTMSYILYYILHSYCYHPWWLVELQLPLLSLVFYCCNSIVIVIDVTLLCCGVVWKEVVLTLVGPEFLGSIVSSKSVWRRSIMDCMDLHGFLLGYALEWVWRLVLMKSDGKTADPRSDRIVCERFGEASDFWREERILRR